MRLFCSAMFDVISLIGVFAPRVAIENEFNFWADAGVLLFLNLLQKSNLRREEFQNADGSFRTTSVSLNVCFTRHWVLPGIGNQRMVSHSILLD
jgi:hypothetical protein